MRPLRPVLWVLPFFLVALSLALLDSPATARWLLRLAEPAGLTVARVDGSLLGTLRLRGLRYRDPALSLEVDALELVHAPWGLATGTLHLRRIALAGVTLRYRSPPTDATTAAPARPVPPPLPLGLRVDALELDGLAAELDDEPLEIDRLRAQLRSAGRWLHLRLDPLEGMGAAVSASGRLGLLRDWPLALALEWRFDPADGPPLAGAGWLDGDLRGISFEHRLERPQAVASHGTIDLEPALRLAVTSRWPRLAWPLDGPPQATLEQGELQLTGTPDAYRLHLATTLRAATAPPLALELRGDGDLTGLTALEFSARPPQGQLDARGSFAWSPEPNWDLVLTAQALDPAALLPDWPGRLDLEARLSGRLAAGEPTLELRLAKLSGGLRERPLSGRGRLRYERSQITAERLELASGANRLRLDGSAGERLDLRFDAELPDPGALLPGSSGRLAARGRLAGSRSAPELEARISGDAVRWSGGRVARLDGDLQWTGERASGRLSGEEITLGNTRVERVTLGLDGRPEAHRVTLDGRADAGGVVLAARGGWDGTLWRGRLERADLDGPYSGPWGLAEPFALTLSQTRAEIARGCWRQADQRLCIGGGWSETGGLDLQFDAAALALSRIEPWLPPDLALDGLVDAQATLSGPPAAPAIDAEVRPGPLKLRLEYAGEAPLELPVTVEPIRLRHGAGGSELSVAARFGEDGHLQGQIALGPAAADHPLSGEARATLPDLELLAALAPPLERFRGRVELDLRLGGRLAQPQLDGRLALSDGAGRIPELGLEPEAIEFALSGSPDGPLTLGGALRSGPGSLAIDGTLTPDPARHWPFTLTVSGRDLAVARLPVAEVDVDPDLRLNGNLREVAIGGTIHIPRARIQLRELPRGAITPSPDEVIVGAGAPPPEPAEPPLRVTSEIRVTFGPEVRLSGHGLETRLEGELELSSSAGLPRALGRLSLVDGRYQKFGQDLTIERGDLIFAGPVTNPTVDLRAFRLSKDRAVKAYLDLSGTLARPDARVTSDPPLPELDATAYLLTGSALPSGGGGDQQALIREAALSQGLDKAQALLGALGGDLGIDELRVESGATFDDSALVIGKHLSPDLYASYVVGLFDNSTAVVLRYRLSERLRLETRTADESQGADLIYEVETD